MDILWAPWRSQYIDTFKHPAGEEECFFCAAVNDTAHDRERLVVARAEHCIVLLNRYPYNGGHLLIAPKEHIGDLSLLSAEVACELMTLSQIAIRVINSISSPHAYNVGMNLGRSAGAGVPGHLHQHVIPRWDGDTGFVSTICDMKVISQAMDNTWQEINAGFKKYL